LQSAISYCTCCFNLVEVLGKLTASPPGHRFGADNPCTAEALTALGPDVARAERVRESGPLAEGGVADPREIGSERLAASAICNLQSAIRNPQSAIRNPQSAICNLKSAIHSRAA
jgi:hypothetical protein